MGIDTASRHWVAPKAVQLESRKSASKCNAVVNATEFNLLLSLYHAQFAFTQEPTNGNHQKVKDALAAYNRYYRVKTHGA